MITLLTYFAVLYALLLVLDLVVVFFDWRSARRAMREAAEDRLPTRAVLLVSSRAVRRLA